MKNAAKDEYVGRMEILDALAAKLDAPGDHAMAQRVLASVIWALRDTVALEDSLHLINDLPLYLKALYLYNWDANYKRSRVSSLEEFLLKVRIQDDAQVNADFGSQSQTLDAVLHVLDILSGFVKRKRNNTFLDALKQTINHNKTIKKEENYAKHV